MEDFDIGKRGITVEMDRPRELVYTLGALRAMEDLAHRWAKKSDIQVPGGIISTGLIMSNLGNDSLLSIALWGALRKEEPKLKLEEVDGIYEAFLERTGDRQDLVEILLDAYARARNPRYFKTLKEQEAATPPASPGPGEKPPGGA